MDPSHDHMAHRQDRQPWWRRRTNLVLIGFLSIGAFFLITEHTAHVLGALPWLLLLSCPLMHLFMHHGHGGHRAHGGGRQMSHHDDGAPGEPPREEKP